MNIEKNLSLDQFLELHGNLFNHFKEVNDFLTNLDTKYDLVSSTANQPYLQKYLKIIKQYVIPAFIIVQLVTKSARELQNK